MDFGFSIPKSRISKLLLVIAVLAFLLPVSAGRTARGQAAQGGLVVDSQSADARFPDMVDFALKAHGFEASRAGLSYRLAGEPVTSELQATVDKPASDLDLSVSLDLSTSYIPPGSEVTYYWTLGNDAGEVYTPEKTFTMQDGRHAWKSLSDTQKRVSVHWYDGDQRFGETLRSSASNALERLERDIGVGLERPASVWVYASQDDLVDALPQNIPEWVGGKAFPELSLVLASISSGEDAGDEIKRVVPHELSHLLLYQATRNPYNIPPAWMDEGLAVHNQEWQDPAEEEALREAAQAGKLAPLRALSGSFGADEKGAILGYAESRSAIDFILRDSRYGPQKFARTVAAFRQGVTYDDAMKAGLGATVDEIDRQWQDSLPYKPAARSAGQPPGSPGGATSWTGVDTGLRLDLTTAGLLVALGACATLFVLGGVVTLVVLVRRRA